MTGSGSAERGSAEARALAAAVKAVLGVEVPAAGAEKLAEAFRRALCGQPAGESPRRPDALARIVGRSAALAAMMGRLTRVARSDATVLVLGENGTGKELVARAVHDVSPRRSGPFVSQNCSAIAETLLESSLFGHVRGAFTGAVADRMGLFEAAHRGALFLDEVAEMSPGLQAKLLRVLEDSTFVPVGSVEPRKVDVRVIAATNRDLRRMVREGTFRVDLYHRLTVLALEVPPLRDRAEDIPLLVDHFLAALAARYGGRKRLTDGCMRRLAAYHWPGNVRELEHEIERLWVMSEDAEAAGEEHLSPEIAAATSSGRGRATSRSLRGQIEALERQQIADALRRTSGNRTRAAELLGVSRRNLIRKIARMGIDEGA